jgi:hypothetical protein
MYRRRILGAAAGGCAAALAGCSLLGDSTGTSADPAEVNDDALSETQFAHDTTRKNETERTVEVGGESRDVTLTNWVAEYLNPIGPALGVEAARFTIFATPTVSVAGQDINPFRRLDDEALIEAMVERSGTGAVEDVEMVSERSVDVLGESVTITEYEAQTAANGVDLRLHLGYRTHEGDFLVLFGAHPDPNGEFDLPEGFDPEMLDASGDIDTLAGGTDHPVDVESGQ